MPSLGIGGAGIAFALYYCGAMLVLLRYMATGRGGPDLQIRAAAAAGCSRYPQGRHPTAVNTVLTNLTVILVTAAVGLFGTTALAAYGISSRLDYVMIPLLFGLCTAVLTMVGVNVGAGQTSAPERSHGSAAWSACC